MERDELLINLHPGGARTPHWGCDPSLIPRDTDYRIRRHQVRQFHDGSETAPQRTGEDLGQGPHQIHPNPIAFPYPTSVRISIDEQPTLGNNGD